LNIHFTQIGKKLASNLPPSQTTFEQYTNETLSSFEFKNISKDEVFELLSKICPDKATGLDNISGSLLKEAASVISLSLCHIVNRYLNT
jgi:hypothetical protein